MSNEKTSRFTKVGSVFKKANGKSGTFVALGNPNSRNEKYKTHVEITVKDATGKKVAETKNGFLTVVNPRDRKGITEEQASKIPQNLVSELYIVEDAE